MGGGRKGMARLIKAAGSSTGWRKWPQLSHGLANSANCVFPWLRSDLHCGFLGGGVPSNQGQGVISSLALARRLLFAPSTSDKMHNLRKE